MADGAAKPGVKFHRLQKEIFWFYRNNCRRKHLNFPVTMEEFIPITTKDCHYCGAPPSNEMRKTKYPDDPILLYQGVDRKNNGRGYSLDNLVPCCYECNSIKGDRLSYEEMREVAKLLLKLRGQPPNPQP